MGNKKGTKRGGGKSISVSLVESAEDALQRDLLLGAKDLTIEESSEGESESESESESEDVGESGSGQPAGGEAQQAVAQAGVQDDNTGEAVTDVWRETVQAPVFQKEASLTIHEIRAAANLNDAQNEQRQRIKAKDLDVDEVADMDERLSKAERRVLEERRAEAEAARLAAEGATPEARADLERLEEVRLQRERAKLRREHEAKKKEELRAKAAERAEALDAKAKGKPKGKKGKGKRK